MENGETKRGGPKSRKRYINSGSSIQMVVRLTATGTQTLILRQSGNGGIAFLQRLEGLDLDSCV
jgi:hypothetical protein